MEKKSEYAMGRFWKAAIVTLTVAAILLAVNQIFSLRAFNFTFVENSYLYLLIAAFLSSMFLLFPGNKDAKKPAWYDKLCFFLTLGLGVLLAANGRNILLGTWSFQAPLWAKMASILLWALALEGARRTAGLAFMIFILIISLYPMYAQHVPGIFQGQSLPPMTVVTYHALSTDSMVGMVMKIFGSTLVGFMLFSLVLEGTGGGKFFIDFAYALLGKSRGGPAKVAVVSSGLMGMVTGSAVANVATVGTLTIPAMKKAGFEPATAAGIEACASVGGVIMPPVMGAVAFIMAGFLGIPYKTVCVVAIIPSVLWYISLFVHVDGEALKSGVRGVSRDQLPNLFKTLGFGWPYVLMLASLVVLLFVYEIEVQAPFYAAALGIVFAMLRKETRITWKKAYDLIMGAAKVLSQLVGVLLPVGLVLGGLTVTGMAQGLTGELIRVAAGNMYLLLVMAMVASFILGIGLTASIVYIILAIAVAPGLIALGLNALGVHFFLLYSGILGDLTPPVALSAFTAGSIAGVSPMKAGWAAMRMSAVLYIVPFLFVLTPGLVLQGSVAGMLTSIPSTMIGVALAAAGIVGYVAWAGRLVLPIRMVLIIAGVFLGWPLLWLRIAGLVVGVAALALNRSLLSRQRQKNVRQLDPGA